MARKYAAIKTARRKVQNQLPDVLLYQWCAVGKFPYPADFKTITKARIPDAPYMVVFFISGLMTRI